MEDWQRIVEFVRLNVASDVYLNRCLVKSRVDGKVVRLSSAGDFTEEAFDGLIRALVATRADLQPALETAMPSLDFSTQMHGMRFRVNIVRAQGQLLCVAASAAGESSLPGEYWPSREGDQSTNHCSRRPGSYRRCDGEWKDDHFSGCD
jgi:hypothetical protein